MLILKRTLFKNQRFSAQLSMWPNILNLLLIPLVFSTGCVDPCDGQKSCKSFVDSCPQNPSFNRVLGSFTPPINYKIRFDVKISNCAQSQTHYRNVIEISEAGKIASCLTLTRQDFALRAKIHHICCIFKLPRNTF